jgi:hemerythrin-like domain-containing protein
MDNSTEMLEPEHGLIANAARTVQEQDKRLKSGGPVDVEALYNIVSFRHGIEYDSNRGNDKKCSSRP